MQTERTRTLLAVLAATACVGTAQAGTIVSSGFDVDPASTSIDTTVPGHLDWGYFLPLADFLDGDQPDNTDWDDLVANVPNTNATTPYSGPATNSKATPGIGIVTITERDAAEYSNGDTGKAWAFTVNDGINPVSATDNPLGAANGIAGGEDIYNITFNELTAGTTIVTLYMDHTNNGRTFSADVDLFASDGDDDEFLISPSIGGTDGEGYFTFTVEVFNDSAGSDLSISIDSNSGSSGQFQLAGYTVTAPVTNVIPEPTSMLVGAVGLGALALRRRRRA